MAWKSQSGRDARGQDSTGFCNHLSSLRDPDELICDWDIQYPRICNLEPAKSYFLVLVTKQDFGLTPKNKEPVGRHCASPAVWRQAVWYLAGTLNGHVFVFWNSPKNKEPTGRHWASPGGLKAGSVEFVQRDLEGQAGRDGVCRSSESLLSQVKSSLTWLYLAIFGSLFTQNG